MRKKLRRMTAGLLSAVMVLANIAAGAVDAYADDMPQIHSWSELQDSDSAEENADGSKYDLTIGLYVDEETGEIEPLEISDLGETLLADSKYDDLLFMADGLSDGEWRSSNAAVLKMNADGSAVALKEGVAKVTYTFVVENEPDDWWDDGEAEFGEGDTNAPEITPPNDGETEAETEETEAETEETEAETEETEAETEETEAEAEETETEAGETGTEAEETETEARDMIISSGARGTEKEVLSWIVKVYLEHSDMEPSGTVEYDPLSETQDFDSAEENADSSKIDLTIGLFVNEETGEMEPLEIGDLGETLLADGKYDDMLFMADGFPDGEWKSSNETVLKVNEDGSAIALKEGESTVTYTFDMENESDSWWGDGDAQPEDGDIGASESTPLNAGETETGAGDTAASPDVRGPEKVVLSWLVKVYLERPALMALEAPVTVEYNGEPLGAGGYSNLQSAFDAITSDPDAMKNTTTPAKLIININTDLDDVQCSLESDISFTLNLNGHTLTGTGEGNVLTLKRKPGSSTATNIIINGDKTDYSSKLSSLPKDRVKGKIVGTIDESAYNRGCGVEIEAGTVKIDDVIISGNGQGAIKAGISSTLSYFTGLDVENNISSSEYGVEGDSSIISIVPLPNSRMPSVTGVSGTYFTDCVITDNQAYPTGVDSMSSIISITNFMVKNTFERCRISGNSAEKSGALYIQGAEHSLSSSSTISCIIDSVISDNIATGEEAAGAVWSEVALTIKDNTVITGNTVPYGNAQSVGGVYQNYTGTKVTVGFNMTDSAIYGNTKSGEPSDFYHVAGKFTMPEAASMKDAQTEGNTLNNDPGHPYVWRQSAIGPDGALGEPEDIEDGYDGCTDALHLAAVSAGAPLPVKEAKIGGTGYATLEKAIAAAESGDTIQFQTGEVSCTPIMIDKPLTIDFTGFTNGTKVDAEFIVKDGGELKLRGKYGYNMSSVGTVTVEPGGSLWAEFVKIDSISHAGAGDSLNLGQGLGTNKWNVNLAEGSYIHFTNAAATNQINVKVAQSVTDKFKNALPTEKIDPVLIANGPGTYNAAATGTISKMRGIITTIGNELVNLESLDGDDAPLGRGIYITKKTINLDNVFLDGINGEDTNYGSLEQPVKTFEQAKKLLGSSNEDDAGKEKVIYIKGTVTVEEDQEWSLAENQKVERYPEFKDPLVQVKSGTLTLSDITIDGGAIQTSPLTGVVSEAPMIVVDSTGKLIIADGAVLQNNNNDTATNRTDDWYFAGGAVASRGTLKMTGGKVLQNRARLGGGIALLDGSFEMTGGEITGNTASKGGVGRPDEAGGYGGGVFIADQAGVTDGSYDSSKHTAMSLTGGTISFNSASDSGGGIAVGYLYTDVSGGILRMTGGTVSDNNATNNGGGLYIQGGGSESTSVSGSNRPRCEAVVSGGTISDNNAGGTEYALYGGGGIYVNGEDGHFNGLLKLTNAIITGNRTRDNGGYNSAGAIASCPSSNLTVYSTKGAAIYNNKEVLHENIPDQVLSEKEGYYPEIFITNGLIGGTSGGHNGNPEVKVASYMLGGGAYHWTDDGKELAINERSNVKMTQPNTEWRFYSESLAEDSPAVKAAEQLAKVHIEGNSADHGGAAIGSNGDVIIGEPDAALLRLEKIVEPEKAVSGEREFTFAVTLSDIAGEISASLTRVKTDGTREQRSISFSEAEPEEIRIRSGEIVLLTGIPAGTKYTVVEKDVNDAVTTKVWWTETAETERSEEVIWDDAADGTQIQADGMILAAGFTTAVTFINTYQTDILIQKIWKDSNGRSLSDMELQTYYNGGELPEVHYELVRYLVIGDEKTQETVIANGVLNSVNKWTEKVENQPVCTAEGSYLYEVREAAVGGWDGSVSGPQTAGNEIRFTLTNTRKPAGSTEPTEPRPSRPSEPRPSQPDGGGAEPVQPAGPETVAIVDEGVPLNPMLALTEIEDEEVPLAFLAPLTGDDRPVGMAALFGLIALGMLGVFGILASKKDEEDAS